MTSRNYFCPKCSTRVNVVYGRSGRISLEVCPDENCNWKRYLGDQE